MTLLRMTLKEAVANHEYWTRTDTVYLRKSPYLPAVETYIHKLAKEFNVSVREVRHIRAVYMKKHPLPHTTHTTRKNPKKQNKKH
jgi:hypothetical protein